MPSHAMTVEMITAHQLLDMIWLSQRGRYWLGNARPLPHIKRISKVE